MPWPCVNVYVCVCVHTAACSRSLGAVFMKQGKFEQAASALEQVRPVWTAPFRRATPLMAACLCLCLCLCLPLCVCVWCCVHRHWPSPNTTTATHTVQLESYKQSSRRLAGGVQHSGGP